LSGAPDEPQLLFSPTSSTTLVVRSSVAPGKPYKEYRQYLRHDFFFSCAYCTMAESEAQAIRLTIDHYEPRKARPKLENVYDNLMYACDECNKRKGDRCPPSEARANGHRFFRPDQDVREEHFQRSGIRVEAKSNVGNYSIEALDLNRQALRRLREIRERLTKCDRHANEGVLGLRTFHIDQLPQEIKGQAALAIKDAGLTDVKTADEIDDLLRRYARSPLIDLDPEAERLTQERMASLKSTEALFPQVWRAPRKKRS
jgi:hypothetical protein